MADLLTDGKRIYQGQPGTGEATLGSAVGAGKKQTILAIHFCNTTSSDATVSLSVVPSGSSAGAPNRIYDEITVRANSTLNLSEYIPMVAGDFISGLQGTAGAITVSVWGTEVSI